MLVPIATNWTTISSLATGAGTLVLAIATFASVRSSNRSARVAEEALLEQRQPVFSSSNFDDPVQKVMFVDQHWVRAEGGRGAADYANGNVYLAISLRNVGAGIGVCQAWAVCTGLRSAANAPQPRPMSAFRAQTRDLYIPPGGVGLWQGAIREVDDPDYASLVEAVQGRRPLSIELLYSDQVGGQRTITRFGLIPTGEHWLATSSRHWFLDRPSPRSDREVQERAEVIFRSVAAADAEAAAEEAQAADTDAAEAAEAAEAEAAQAEQAAEAEGAQADGGAADPVATQRSAE